MAQSKNCPFGVYTKTELKNRKPMPHKNGIWHGMFRQRSVPIYSVITPTTVHIQYKIYKILHIKTLKTLRHVSVLRPPSGSYIFLAKVTLACRVV